MDALGEAYRAQLPARYVFQKVKFGPDDIIPVVGVPRGVHDA